MMFFENEYRPFVEHALWSTPYSNELPMSLAFAPELEIKGWDIEEIPNSRLENKAYSRRLAKEMDLLRSFGLEAELFRTENGDLGFSFQRSRAKEIVILTHNNHPKAAPRLFLIRSEGSEEEVRKVPWSSDSWLIHIVVPFLGPNIDSLVNVEQENKIHQNISTEKEVIEHVWPIKQN